jgi:erythromycin esterase-like protein
MENYLNELVKNALPLHEHEAIGPLIQSIKDKKIVMIGEATHGTEEFYKWRQHISQELIMNHGFNIIGIEGDWPASHEVNKFIKGDVSQSARETLSHFKRWPTWMWANVEFLSFMEWLKVWNETAEKKINFYGLDLYSLYESMDQVVAILRENDLDLISMVAENYQCLEKYRPNEKSYVKSLHHHPQACRKQVTEVLRALKNTGLDELDEADKLNLIQNAQIVVNAENYYRSLISGQSSWNIRDEHMMATIQMLLDYQGKDAKMIIWEHNTHVGDYRATDMVLSGDVNIGGLAREIYGKEEVALVGFGTYSGSVTASYKWDGPIQIFDVPEGRERSVELFCHQAVPKIGSEDFYILLNEIEKSSSLSEVLGHRAIGVVYDPELEHRGNYVPTSLLNRYDAFIFLNHTHYLKALNAPFDYNEIPQTYPFGNRI